MKKLTLIFILLTLLNISCKREVCEPDFPEGNILICLNKQIMSIFKPFGAVAGKEVEAICGSCIYDFCRIVTEEDLITFQIDINPSDCPLCPIGVNGFYRGYILNKDDERVGYFQGETHFINLPDNAYDVKFKFTDVNWLDGYSIEDARCHSRIEIVLVCPEGEEGDETITDPGFETNDGGNPKWSSEGDGNEWDLTGFGVATSSVGVGENTQRLTPDMEMGGLLGNFTLIIHFLDISCACIDVFSNNGRLLHTFCRPGNDLPFSAVINMVEPETGIYLIGRLNEDGECGEMGSIEITSVSFKKTGTEETICSFGESTCFNIIEDAGCTLELTATNDVNAFGFDYSQNLVHRLRLDAYLRHPTYQEERTVFVDSAGNRRLSYAELSKEYNLVIAEIPEWLHDAVIMMMSMSTFTIDGETAFKTNDVYQIAWNKRMQLARSETTIVKPINMKNSKC